MPSPANSKGKLLDKSGLDHFPHRFHQRDHPSSVERNGRTICLLSVKRPAANEITWRLTRLSCALPRMGGPWQSLPGSLNLAGDHLLARFSRWSADKKFPTLMSGQNWLKPKVPNFAGYLETRSPRGKVPNFNVQPHYAATPWRASMVVVRCFLIYGKSKQV